MKTTYPIKTICQILDLTELRVRQLVTDGYLAKELRAVSPVDLGGRVGVTANDPQFVCRTSDVSSAPEGDALVTGSVNYTIRDVIDDGTGMTTLMLEAD